MKAVILAAAGAAAAIAFAAGAASAQTESVSFRLENNTGAVLVALHISDTGTNDWEEDVLDVDVVMPGESVDVTIDDGLSDCEYDVRADFSDGDTIDVRGVDFCELDGETLTIGE